MPSIEIIRVEKSAELSAFIEVPWNVYRGDPNWAPPIKKYVRKLLDTARHPFWRFSDQLLLLARRNNKVVGRIAGIVDRNFNQRHNTRQAAWGFFECDNDPEAALALFTEVESWAQEKGMKRLLGPFNPSTNYEVGTLVEGFQHPATFMMPYNPPYYMDLVDSAGFRKEKDLLSFMVDKSWRLQEWMQKISDRIRREGHVTIKHCDKKTFVQDLELIKRIYDDCWAGNWGFVPMTDEEFAEMGETLLKIVDTDFAFILLYKDEPAGVGVAVPDINPLLKRMNGKIGISGAMKALLFRKEIKGLRGLLFGIKKDYRASGLPFFALDYMYDTIRRKPAYSYLELGWNLEDNKEINQLELDCGARLFKRYRIFGKSVTVAE